ncbi:hypothetical protein [Fluviicola sp.]|uniref:hypothetical protein n=1 Tax=Fluviicola sp. TaxID=1917219 RepID=UPI003D27D256
MKNIDQIIKKSLENHELPYNEAAWESMSKRLDGTTPSPFYRKWWVAASIGTILVGSAIFFSLNSKSESSKAIEPNTQIANESNTTVQTNKPTENRLNSHDTPQTNTLNEQQNASNSTEKVEESTNPHRISNEIPEVTASNNSNPPIINAQKSENGNHGTPSEQKTYLPVLITQTNLCIGDEIEITNPNDGLSISVVQNNRTQIIKAGSKKVITANNEGAIEVVSGKTVQTITVNKPNDKLYISADPTILYDNGIPSIEFNVAGNESGVQWSVEKYHGEIRNGNFIVHPYTGKDITVKVTSKDLNGCTVSETKNITLKEEYNLQAVNTFNINSNDPRNTRFMPYALIERNVAFELFIYDAKSGRVIYKTNDTSSGWDGTDMNTGSVVQLNSIYGWKVIMKNPLPGEPKEYKGTILVNN